MITRFLLGHGEDLRLTAADATAGATSRATGGTDKAAGRVTTGRVTADCTGLTARLPSCSCCFVGQPLWTTTGCRFFFLGHGEDLRVTAAGATAGATGVPQKAAGGATGDTWRTGRVTGKATGKATGLTVLEFLSMLTL